MSEDLTRVDSAVAGVHEEHHKEAHHYHRRGSAGNENVRSIKDLSTLSIVISSPHSSPLHSLTSICLSPPTEEEDVELAVAPETQKLNWYVHHSDIRFPTTPLLCSQTDSSSPFP